MANPKKQSFLGGAAVLAGAAAVVKLIGAVYKIPLNNILGQVGKTYFDTAYSIYNVLLTISTAGLPLAISKLTSQAHAQGRENQKRKLFRTAIWLFFALGLVGSVFMFFRAESLAAYMNTPMARLPIRTLAPAVFCVCLLACMRGYTQGQGNMTPTAVSQILEALCKVGIGLPCAWYLIQLGRGLDAGAAGAILGVTAGTVLSMCFLIVYLLRHRERERSLDVPESSGALLRQILAIGIPITLSNSAMSIISMIDTKIVMGRLQSGLLLAEEQAAALNGEYRFAMDMVNMVVAFAYPVTMSLLPTASAALAQRDTGRVDRIISSAFRVIILLSLPAGVGLSVLSTPIMRLILPAQQEAALAAGPHLRILGFACILIFLMILTNAILQTYGKELLPIFTVITGGLVKIVMNYFLVGRPEININGAPISTLCCYSVIVALNLLFVWRYSPKKPRYPALFARPILASVLMGGAAWAVYGFASRLLSGGGAVSYGENALATLCGIGAGVVVYGVLVIALRILRAEDVAAIPHGKTLIKVLHLK
ncbi:MAG: polysaccharide biosynthesis protein [Oscillibacter sp.]|nr:polysaccharide biosynthesis protein [Oscillibacter sp.]MBR1690813.1 polysaccharide biosynthesis protein [Oscillibacter sp.]